MYHLLVCNNVGTFEYISINKYASTSKRLHVHFVIPLAFLLLIFFTVASISQGVHSLWRILPFCVNRNNHGQATVIRLGVELFRSRHHPYLCIEYPYPACPVPSVVILPDSKPEFVHFPLYTFLISITIHFNFNHACVNFRSRDVPLRARYRRQLYKDTYP